MIHLNIGSNLSSFFGSRYDNISIAINLLIDLSRLGNKYLADEEPWKLYKSGNVEKVKKIMY